MNETLWRPALPVPEYCQNKEKQDGEMTWGKANDFYTF